MLYSRSEIVALVREQPQELQATLISLMWHASKGDPNLVENGRYGLLQLDPNQLSMHGFIPRTAGARRWNTQDADVELLDPATNIRIGAKLLSMIGLVEFAGRNLAPQLPAIISLAAWLDSEPDIAANHTRHCYDMQHRGYGCVCGTDTVQPNN